MSRRNWSRQETLMALAFYLCPPFPRKNWDDGDAEIQLLAGEIGRTESTVCFKIANLKACDQTGPVLASPTPPEWTDRS